MGGRAWSGQDISLFKRMYPKTPAKALAAYFNRTLVAIESMSRQLRLRKVRQYCRTYTNAWTKEELGVLARGWDKRSFVWITQRLPGRTVRSIRDKAKSLGYGRRLRHTGLLSRPQAAKLMGVSLKLLTTIIQRESVTKRYVGIRRTKQFYYVSRKSITVATKRFLRRESLVEASDRLNADPTYLRAAVRSHPIHKKKHRTNSMWRLLPEEWDAVWRQREKSVSAAKSAKRLPIRRSVLRVSSIVHKSKDRNTGKGRSTRCSSVVTMQASVI